MSTVTPFLVLITVEILETNTEVNNKAVTQKSFTAGKMRIAKPQMKYN